MTDSANFNQDSEGAKGQEIGEIKQSSSLQNKAEVKLYKASYSIYIAEDVLY